MEVIFLVCAAGGPQLKRNPLGTHGVTTKASTLGYLILGSGFLGGLFVLHRASRYRTSESRPSFLESWTKAVDPANYTERGRRLIPWIWMTIILFGIGTFIVITSD